jgi:hypothetical protein
LPIPVHCKSASVSFREREIYSSLFLHPQTVLNDIETLLMEEGSHPPQATVTK